MEFDDDPKNLEQQQSGPDPKKRSDCDLRANLSRSQSESQSRPSAPNQASQAGRTAELSRSSKSSRSSRSSKGSLTNVSVLLDRLVGKLDLDRRLKEHALMSMWPTIAGDAFQQSSHPVFIDSEANLVIAVKDSSTGQELSLIKPQLLAKLRVISNSVGVKLHGLRFDLKLFWTTRGPKTQLASELDASLKKPEVYRKPTAQELQQIAFGVEDEDKIAQLRANLNEQPTLEAGTIERIVAGFAQELKFNKWQEQQGFPTCAFCRQPTQIQHGKESLCCDCYFRTLAGS